jgi:hypothetical protein
MAELEAPPSPPSPLRSVPVTPRKESPKVVVKPTPRPEKKPTPPKALTRKLEGPAVLSVKSFDVFTAFQLHNDKMEPLEEEPFNRDYNSVRVATLKFYTNHLKREYGSKFVDIKVAFANNTPKWKTNKPDHWYNVYIEWDLEVSFLVQAQDDTPSRWELTQSVVTANCTKYLKDYVRTLEGTPFANTTGVFTKQYAS